jgi:hypothetical protein
MCRGIKISIQFQAYLNCTSQIWASFDKNFVINFITIFAANNNEDRFDMTFKKNEFNNGKQWINRDKLDLHSEICLNSTSLRLTFVFEIDTLLYVFGLCKLT